MVGIATVSPLLVSGVAALFGAGVITKAAHKDIHAGVDMYRKMNKKKTVSNLLN